MDEIYEKTVEAAKEEFSKLKTADAKEKDAGLKRIDTYLGHIESMKRIDNEHEEKMARLNMEKEQYDDGIIDRRDEMMLRSQEFEEKKKARIGGYIYNGVETAIKVAVVVGCAIAGYAFEEEHSFTSSFAKGFNKYILGFIRD